MSQKEKNINQLQVYIKTEKTIKLKSLNIINNFIQSLNGYLNKKSVEIRRATIKKILTNKIRNLKNSYRFISKRIKFKRFKG